MGPQEFALQDFAPQEVALLVAAALCTAALIVLLAPLFRRYALARPNARSSHTKPTPQGGGVAIVLAIIITLGFLVAFATQGWAMLAEALPLGGAVVILTVVGALDDVFTIAVLPRLALQAGAVALVVATLPAEVRAVPMLPLVVERGAEMLAGVWFVNLVNFMDGIDWMTVAESVPVAASIFVFALLDAAPAAAGLVALALAGAMLGFAPFNRPVAKLFLGDVGSLPVGLILFWLLLRLAGDGHVAAALLLPLYYIADATITLFARLARGERVTQAHRSHFYQIATSRGFSVITVVRLVFAVNLALATLAALSITASSNVLDVAALLLGSMVVAALLVAMRRGRR